MKLPDDKFEKMKLIVALAATAQAFVGPTARLPSASVGRTLQVKAQPAMLLGGLRARANNLVPARRPQNSARPGSLARETPQNPASLDPSMQVATKAESAEVSTTEKKGFLGGMDVPLLAYFFFWYLGNYYCPATASETSAAPWIGLLNAVDAMPRRRQHLEQDGP